MNKSKQLTDTKSDIDIYLTNGIDNLNNHERTLNSISKTSQDFKKKMSISPKEDNKSSLEQSKIILNLAPRITKLDEKKAINSKTESALSNYTKPKNEFEYGLK